MCNEEYRVPTEQQLFDDLRRECWNYSFQSFGYAYIFDKRASKYSTYINWLTVFGILTPSIIGATALGYGIKNILLEKMIIMAIPITIIQFIFSVLSIIFKWSDELSHSYESSQAYSSLYYDFRRLAKYPPNTYNELKHDFELLELEYIKQNQQDLKHNIKEYELRKGMRYMLREHKKECVGCKIIPISMKSTDCPVCGNYSFNYTLID